MKNLVVVSRGGNTQTIFKDMFKKVVILHPLEPYEVKEDDVLLFEGGTDISSSLYGEKRNTYCGMPDETRDEYEVSLFLAALKVGASMIGICRGSQLLCALSGGKLIQHVNNHTVDHFITDYKGRHFFITSSHHQMMLPQDTKHKLLAYCKEASVYLGENDKCVDVPVDTEIVFFEETKALAIQGHPEWMYNSSTAVRCCREYVKDFILN